MLLLQFVGCGFDAGFVRGIEEQEFDLKVILGERGNGFLASFFRAGAKDDVMAGPGELAADFEADAFIGPGDEDGLGR